MNEWKKIIKSRNIEQTVVNNKYLIISPFSEKERKKEIKNRLK